MESLVFGLIYLIFFLSGAAALIYEIVWVRYLMLIFGGSHLAVTAVLTVFMSGLALGSYLIGKRAVSKSKLLRLYGFLELGIAASALLFFALIKLYPSLYVPLAGIAPSSSLYLSFLRIAFAAAALIVPTTLMGGTLPILSTFIESRAEGVGKRLSFLYGLNTVGAVAGAGVTGFFLLRLYSVNTAIFVAVMINVLVGLLSVFLQDRAQTVVDAVTTARKTTADVPLHDDPKVHHAHEFPVTLVLLGIGISGFCALAYEVLWTRVLSIVVGASVYGFTVLLMAFLAGIGLGSSAYGLFLKTAGPRIRRAESDTRVLIVAFGIVQVIIGLSALVVSAQIRYLPTQSYALFQFLQHLKIFGGPFETRQLANFILAFLFMAVPAFFMGVAFPLAGKIHGRYKKQVSAVVGEVLMFNTIGAILGSAVSGFVLIYLFGIQRSLEVIVLINVAYGMFVIVSIQGKKILTWGLSAAAATVLVLVLTGSAGDLWDRKFFAIYQSNHPEMFETPDAIHNAMKKTDVLYYAEGVESTVSSIRSGASQFFITNGRVEAANSNEDMQCQYTLGHLPMLLHKNPKTVFVLGTGSGMTLGAVSVHPSVQKITLAEIEPKVLGVARTFRLYNHDVLSNPKLHIVFNDGRNFLLTTKEKFDVITADPIHPWFSGAGYLYSDEYFALAAQRLNPGGILCQWLPLYELTEKNLKSVVETLRKNFAYTMIWLTHDDAELVASNSPIVIDEDDLERRIRVPEIQQDLRRVKMGTAEDFLSYFLMGNSGTRAYGSGARINTDNNLYLEFSAPRNIGIGALVTENVFKLVKYREPLLPYLRVAEDKSARAKQKARWEQNEAAAILVDPAHVLNLARQTRTKEYRQLAAELQARFPKYAPWRFLNDETFDVETGEMTAQGSLNLLRRIELLAVDGQGQEKKILFSAVLLTYDKEYARLYFVDGNSETVFGQLRIRDAQKDEYATKYLDKVFARVLSLYRDQQNALPGKGLPRANSLFPKIKTIVEFEIDT